MISSAISLALLIVIIALGVIISIGAMDLVLRHVFDLRLTEAITMFSVLSLTSIILLMGVLDEMARGIRSNREDLTDPTDKGEP